MSVLRRRAKRIVVLLWLAATLLFAVGIVVVTPLRLELAEWLTVQAFERRGFAVRSLSVTALDIHGAVLADIQIGSEDEFAADRLILRYDVVGLLRGLVREARFENPTLRLDVSDPTAFFAGLPREARTTGSSWAAELFQVRGLRLQANTGVGLVHAVLDGRVERSRSGKLFASVVGRLSANFKAMFDRNQALDTGPFSTSQAFAEGSQALEVEIARLTAQVTRSGSKTWAGTGSFEGVSVAFDEKRAVFVSAAMEGKVHGGMATFRAALSGNDDASNVTLSLQASDYDTAPQVALDLGIGVSAAFPALAWLPMGPPTKGQARITLSIDGRLPRLASLHGGWPRSYEDSSSAHLPTLQARLKLAAEDIDYPGYVRSLGGSLELEGETGASAVSVRISRDARFSAVAVNAHWLSRLGVPYPLARLFSAGGILEARSGGEFSTHVRLGVEDDARQIGFSGDVVLRPAGEGMVRVGTSAQLLLNSQWVPLSADVPKLVLTARALQLPSARLTRFEGRTKLSGPWGGLRGECDVDVLFKELTTAPGTARELSLQIPALVQMVGQGTELRLRERARIEVTEVRGYRYRSLTPLVFEFTNGRILLAREGARGVVLSYRFNAAMQDVGLRLEDSQALRAPFTASLTNGQVEGVLQLNTRAHRGELTIGEASFSRPRSSIALRGVRAKLDAVPRRQGKLAEFSVTQLRAESRPVSIAPLKLTGGIRRQGEDLALTARITDALNKFRLGVSGEHSPRLGRGQLSLALQPLRFSPANFQPSDLFPGLGDPRRVSGELKGNAQVVWSRGDLSGVARVKLDGLDFELGATRVRGLRLDLMFADLFPPSTPAGQLLSVRRIEAPVPMDALQVRFHVRSDGATNLVVEEGRLRTLGGRIWLADSALDPEQQRYRFTFGVQGLELAQLFAALAVDGLSGTGRLKGRIPIAIEEESVVLLPVRLEATEPGRLRLASKQARALLPGDSEQVELLLQVLRDFRYRSLVLTLTKSAMHDLQAKLSVLGHNPEVAGGRDVQLNVNLDTNIGGLLKALSGSYRLSSRVLKRLRQPE